MRTLIAVILSVWLVLTVLAYSVVLPDSGASGPMARAYLEVGPNDPGPAGDLVRRAFHDLRFTDRRDDAGSNAPDDRVRAFADWYARTHGRSLATVPRLVWSTDDNPARRTQCALFRAWHLRRYGTPVDIITDPSNRDPTKTIVQCVAGAGPDIIEAYGPAQLSQFVDAGVAMDLTDLAREKGFDEGQVFSASISSMSLRGRQYAFPCNVGYTVVFYHADLFKEAGVEPPPRSGGWTLEQAVSSSKLLSSGGVDGSRRRVGIMGMGAWGMALAEGATFFNASGTASTFNSPASVGAFQSFLDLMYTHKVMPTPAELASMASSGGANMNMGAEAASASALFSAKACVMINDGRWSYVTFARRQVDRVIAPAIRRQLGAVTNPRVFTEQERGLLRSALESLLADVLVPISDEQYDLVVACLTDEDRRNLLQIGVAHVPTGSGVPYYEAAARVAIVNRAGPRADLAARFIEFLSSEEYNNQINFTFDSISGTPRIIARSGISGPPRALPGLEAFDSPVFVEAMEQYGHPWELSPFIGRNRLGQLVGPIIEQLTNNTIGAAEAARLIEGRINAQMHANLSRDGSLRAEWEKRTGKTFDSERPLREQVESSLNDRGRG